MGLKAGRRRRPTAAFSDSHGGVAVIFAMAVPVLAVLICGAIDLASVNTDRTLAQDVVDSAALTAAKQLGIGDPKSIGPRAEAFIKSELAPLDSRFTYTVKTDPANDDKSVTVTVEGRRASFFVNLLPPGGWKVHAEATASRMGQVPLCVLNTGSGGADKLDMQDSAQITAVSCLVHGNGDLGVGSAAWLRAAMVQASGLATGRISPSPQQGAPAIDDPFKSLDLKAPGSLCLPVDVLLNIGLNTLPAGVHCANYMARTGTTLKLLPGEHYFKGQLTLKDDSVLQGTNVVLVFDDKSDFHFQDSSKVDLTGRTSGKLAGFVMATTRKNTSNFEISSSNARRLLGTIYVPAATLEVSGSSNSVADQSAWTVVVAKQLKLKGGANLVINANYAGSSVPAPTGVGPSTNSVALTK
jgi:hypothetical protein